MFRILPLLICILLAASPVAAQVTRLKMATTTSTDNSGLLAVLNPPFEREHQVQINVISVGTGKALRLAQSGDVDFILVHAPEAEQAFVKAGYGIERAPVMHNSFIIVGPASDPAQISTAKNTTDAMLRLIQTQHIFVSRGDDSGTHQKEKKLWAMTNAEPTGDWYLSVGQGMGPVLLIANAKQGYALADKGTYLAYKDKIDLPILFFSDDALFNPYHVILVNPDRHPHVKVDLARKYAAFIRSARGQELIRQFRINGEMLFHPTE